MMDPKELMAEAAVLEPQLQNWRRTLHRHPEVGFDLPQTRALVKQALSEMGYTPQDCGKAGILVLAGGKQTKTNRRQKAGQDHSAARRHGRSAHSGGVRRGLCL